MAVTTVYGVIGSPIEHSLSPSIHNAAFNALGIDAAYYAFD
ncbi:MAG: shikimate dehydrogenase, partial [Halobacteriota archaeon]